MPTMPPPRFAGSAIYVLYSDEGHGFQRPENGLDFDGRTEAFLAQYLGGRLEPITGDKIVGSTAVVKIVGAKGGARGQRTPGGMPQ
jgi:hypothetical protein